MDLPEHIVVSPVTHESKDSTTDATTQIPPEIYVIHPCVPDDVFSVSGVNNPMFTGDISLTSSRDSSYNLQIDDVDRNNQLLSAHSLPYLPSVKTWDNFSATSPSLTNTTYSLDMDKGLFIYEKMHSLIASFSRRARKMKQDIVRPVTPSSGSEFSLDSYVSYNGSRHHNFSGVTSRSSSRRDSKEHYERNLNTFYKFRISSKWCNIGSLISACLQLLQTIEPQSKCYILWLLFMSLCYLYNACGIFLRAAFPYETPDNVHLLLALDYTSDAAYLIDLLVMKPRIKVLLNGFWVDDFKVTSKVYMKSWNFLLDAMSLLPINFLYLRYDGNPLLRLPRLLKIQTFWEFFRRFESIAKSPYFIRIGHTVIYMLFLIHLNACAYYAYSDYEGIGRPDNMWVYNGEGNAYIRCFLFATKIATSIGKNPLPQNAGECLFMTVSWLSGVFIFAMLIGQIRDILHIASKKQEEYRKVMDRTLVYMKRFNLTKVVRDRTRLWFAYNWFQQKTLDEGRILKKLPLQMQMDIAMHVHFDIFSKVKLFQDFDRTLMQDIILKLRPYLYLPGGFICRKGEVGTEMFIVNDGQVLVMGGDDNNTVMATLGKGSVFGEVSLLSVGYGTRRTTDVRSRGFSNLFLLSKTDLHSAIRDYPMAQEILRRRAKRILKSSVFSNGKRKTASSLPSSLSASLPSLTTKRPTTPKLLHTVLQVVSPYSMTAQLITRGSRVYPQSAPPLGPQGTSSTSPQSTEKNYGNIQVTNSLDVKMDRRSSEAMQMFSRQTEIVKDFSNVSNVTLRNDFDEEMVDARDDDDAEPCVFECPVVVHSSRAQTLDDVGHQFDSE